MIITLHGQQEMKDKLLACSIPVTETGCWIWLGSHKTAGYGRIRIKTGRHLAHRVSYEVFKGSIPDGLTIDHLCRVRCCINPDHLRAVTISENVMAENSQSKTAILSRQTHCKNGHEFDISNTRVNKKRQRICRLCARAYMAWRRATFGREW